MQNEPFACGSSSTAVRQALDKALDKRTRNNTNKVASIPSNGQPFRWVKNDDEAAFHRGAASEPRGAVAPPLVVR